MKFPTIFIIIFLLNTGSLAAQEKVLIKAVVDRNKILIGEHIQLRLEADIPENEPIRFFDIDSIPHFELLDKGGIDTVNTSSGTTLKQIIRITSFDSGHWVIPAFIWSGNMTTDSIPVDVGFSSFDPSQDYHDIKDIIEVTPEKQKYPWWWWAAGGGLLLLLLVIWLLIRKKKPEIKQPPQVISPFEEAMKQLDALRMSKPAPREFYSSLVDIFRVYIFRKKGVLSLQKTTDDLVVQLVSLGLEKEYFRRLAQALQLSDFVKFAKYIPGREDDQAAYETIKESIEAIERIGLSTNPPIDQSTNQQGN